ncbi:MAG TPA: hypothetical protein PKL92_01380 [Aquaticitalea sp.]|nr:hypothetical protein [Aquaticitalea sp.]HNU59041.1 hypothetical protein [Aquaticitalea sp.]
MNEAFTKQQIPFMLKITAFAVLLFAAHSYLIAHFAENVDFFFPLWQIYGFHALVTTALFTIVNYRLSKAKTDVFGVFMTASLVKMVMAVVFLLPLILSDFEKKQPDVFNFFIPYFLFLFFEVYSVAQLLQKNP